MANAVRDAAGPLVGGLYKIDLASALPQAGAPLPAYAASRDGQGGFAAVAVARGWPARLQALGALTGTSMPNLLLPLAHGVGPAQGGGTGYYVVCAAPPGPPLSAAPRKWGEAELLEHVLQPAAQMLARLQARAVTHRAIRAENVYQAGPGAAVTFGCAWAAPPAAHQPAWMEPPASAACLPAGRGDGAAADDVYALGALMLQLALGRNPVDGMADEAVLRAKLDAGSFDALVGRNRLPPFLTDLLQGMLADEPEHRPSPELLQNPAAARLRRVASRPARRSQSAFQVGRSLAWNAATLAHDLAAEPARGGAMLRDRSVMHWVRRSLGDSQAAGQLDAVLQTYEAESLAVAEVAEPLLVMRAIAVLNPLAPFTWRSLSLWPDGLGAALNQSLRETPEQSALFAEIINARALPAWRDRRGSRSGLPTRLEAPETRSWLAGSRSGLGISRLSYVLNPLAPCEDPATQQDWVVRLGELLPVLEQHASAAPEGQLLLSSGVNAFILARRDERLDADLSRLGGLYSEGDVLTQARLLARLQANAPELQLPALSARVADRLASLLGRFGSRSRRERMVADLAALGTAGSLAPMVALLAGKTELDADEAGRVAAQDRRAEIERQLAGLEQSGVATRAQPAGRDIVDALGLAGCVLAASLAIFG